MQNDTLIASHHPHQLPSEHSASPVLLKAVAGGGGKGIAKADDDASTHEAIDPTPRNNTSSSRQSSWQWVKNWLLSVYNHPHTQRCINFTSGLCMGSLCFYSITELFHTLSRAWLAWIPYPIALAVAFSIADIVCTIILFTKLPQPERYDEPHWIWYYFSTLSSLLVASICCITAYVFTLPFVGPGTALIMGLCGFATNIQLFMADGAYNLQYFFGYSKAKSNAFTSDSTAPTPCASHKLSSRQTHIIRVIAIGMAWIQSFAYAALNRSALFVVLASFGILGSQQWLIATLLSVGLFAGELKFNTDETFDFLNNAAQNMSTERPSQTTAYRFSLIAANVINAVANGLIVLGDFKRRLTKGILFLNASLMSFFVMTNASFPHTQSVKKANTYLPTTSSNKRKVIACVAITCCMPIASMLLPAPAVSSLIFILGARIIYDLCTTPATRCPPTDPRAPKTPSIEVKPTGFNTNRKPQASSDYSPINHLPEQDASSPASVKGQS